VVRFARSTGDERLQLKWFAAAAVLVVATFIALILTNSNSAAAAILNNLALLSLNAAITIAVLKYRLYEIDRIISRTLAYTIVTGLLVGLYAGLVLLATEVLSFSSPVAVAASTLVAAALFSPLRRRVQRVVDRRFNRAHYDTHEMVAAFAVRPKDTVDPDAVQADLANVVHRALEPAHVSMWMNNGG
jgi:DMSO reductase anchor subunit